MTIDRSFAPMSRRDSLRTLALGAGALAAPQLLKAKGDLASNGLTLAVQQYSFNRQLRAGELDILDYPKTVVEGTGICLLYTSPSPRDSTRSRMPSSA